MKDHLDQILEELEPQRRFFKFRCFSFNTIRFGFLFLHDLDEDRWATFSVSFSFLYWAINFDFDTIDESEECNVRRYH